MLHFAMPLLVRQRREIEVEEVAEGFGMVLEGLLGRFLQFGPAPPRVSRGMGDVAQEAEPFDVGS